MVMNPTRKLEGILTLQPPTWRIIPGRGSVIRITPIYKPFKPYRKVINRGLANHGSSYLPIFVHTAPEVVHLSL